MAPPSNDRPITPLRQPVLDDMAVHGPREHIRRDCIRHWPDPWEIALDMDEKPGDPQSGNAADQRLTDGTRGSNSATDQISFTSFKRLNRNKLRYFS